LTQFGGGGRASEATAAATGAFLRAAGADMPRERTLLRGAAVPGEVRRRKTQALRPVILTSVF
jgi:hypothetical protein